MISDSSRSLNTVLTSSWFDHADEIKVAALYVRSDQKHFVDWYWKVEDEWVVFPWDPES